MQTKLIAAELATAAGVATVIISSDRPSDIVDVISRGLPSVSARGSPTIGADGRKQGSDADLSSSIASLTPEESSLVGHPPLSDPAHTLFLPQPTPLPSRKWSVLHALHPTGMIIIDEGAWKRIRKHESGGRLLPAGVVGTKGHWERMQAVRLVVRQGSTSGAGARVVAPSAPSSAPGTPPVVDALRNNHGAASSAFPLLAATAASPLASDGSGSGSGAAEAGAGAWTEVEVGRCLANYTSEEVARIKGLKSSEIEHALGFADSEYVTDTVVLLEGVAAAAAATAGSA